MLDGNTLLIGTAEAAKLLGTTNYTVRRMIRRGTLPAKREIGGENTRLWINPEDLNKILVDSKTAKLETVNTG